MGAADGLCRSLLREAETIVETDFEEVATND